jgi:nucleotide-binding universal stress UspA family protein
MHCVPDPVPEDAQLLLAESTAGMAEKYPDVHVTLTVSKGLPEPCLELASQRMDLLVVGRRHAGALSHVLSGDVGMHVVEHGRTVVALVPETPGPTNPGHGTSGPDLRPAEPER